MTDHSRYKSPSGAQLTLRRRTGDSLDLDERLFLMVDGRGMFIPTAELLAMIDAADPDAMRAYLRETAPEVIADLYRPETPEADSPEDVDELPDRDDTTEAAQIDRSWALDKAADALGRLSAVGSPAGALPLLDVAGWIIDGTVNTPGEVIS